jgi:predicted nuclease of predicted toxin-antitoxin system
VKFLVDMPLPPALARWLTAQGHDAVHASALGLGRSTDTEILTRARQDARTVITADLDCPRLLALAGAEGRSLILFRGGDRSEPDVIARMQQIFHPHGRDRDNAEHHCCRSHSGASAAPADYVTVAGNAVPSGAGHGPRDNRRGALRLDQDLPSRG